MILRVTRVTPCVMAHAAIMASRSDFGLGEYEVERYILTHGLRITYNRLSFDVIANDLTCLNKQMY